jgi:hypothetical protein
MLETAKSLVDLVAKLRSEVQPLKNDNTALKLLIRDCTRPSHMTLIQHEVISPAVIQNTAEKSYTAIFLGDAKLTYLNVPL